jgi:hypothetical protein
MTIVFAVIEYRNIPVASIAQLGERQTEDLKALCSIHSRGR